MAKRGPKTEEGKAVVRLNAVRHGVLSTTPVIPDLEREEDWQAHRSGVLASLAPEGHLESILAERVALLFWRLQRVARYEREAIASAPERMLSSLPGMRQERLLPDGSSLDRVIRYEAHLHRQLLQTMHELEALQARRQGRQTPLARVDVQGLADQ
jgi:hypothetical protein